MLALDTVDTVDRSILFYKLLSKYQIGGKFLKLLSQMYEVNQMFVKLTAGLAQPFSTTVGVKQGCFFLPCSLIFLYMMFLSSLMITVIL